LADSPPAPAEEEVTPVKAHKAAKPTATWAANPLAFQTGASDRAARAKAHRRGAR
jgi:hypothetical protein